MTRDLFISEMVPSSVCMNPTGFIADELTPEQFHNRYTVFFEHIFEIGKANLEGVGGYGEFNHENQAEYTTCKEFLLDTFSEDHEGYWYQWKEMLETTVLTQDFFERYHKKMEEYIEYCEGRRYLVNNNTFFVNMVTDGEDNVGFADWSRAGVADFLLDFVIMDLNKPYLQIPELLNQYCKERKIEIPDFKERYLCMSYYKGIDTLRWHASIDDVESCQSIMQYIEELEDRIRKIQ